MAHRAASGESQPDLRRGFSSIARIEHQILFCNRTTFIGRDIATVKTAGHALFNCLLVRHAGSIGWKQITGKLQDSKTIKRNVCVQRLDHPFSKTPHLPIVVKMNAMRVGKPGIIEPIATAMFTPLRRCEQRINKPFVGIASFVGDKRRDK